MAISEPESLHDTQYFKKRMKLPPSLLDFDRFGILYQHGDLCYVIFNAPAGRKSSEGIQRRWFRKHDLGTHLTVEWDTLRHVKVGDKGTGASGHTDESAWHYHSKVLMGLRVNLARAAQVIESSRSHATKKPSEDQVLAALGQEFSRIVTAVYGTLRVQEKKKAKEAEELFDEFCVA
ncbi:hypothetical protein EK21DRAFT_115520 [Setomelanomma holmii]|uniref:Uncharacterized protein n=1 Tax=Setomelanomma holmii TaxID=210430 RepID=A0A9P4H3F3_9PLEO|nr:hypothetical protein EK21DRAFT_115520 [Setomelanomma holmii]